MSIIQEKIAPLGSLDFKARQIVEGFMSGLHKSPFHGFSVEFAEHRLYNAGDSIKNIDWKLYGRTDKLFVKRFDEETNLRCQLVIDISSSMYFPVDNAKSLNKLRFSVYAAASLMQLMLRQRDAVGLDLFDDDIRFHAEAKLSPTHQKIVLHQLENLLGQYDKNNLRPTSTITSLHKIAELLHRRSLVIVFSDMLDNTERYDEMFEALEHLRYNKHEVILFHVYDGELEQNLNLQNRLYQFVDMETAEVVKLNPTEIHEKYLASMQQKKEQLLQHCYQYHIDYVEADINKGYEQVLVSYLLKRQRLY